MERVKSLTLLLVCCIIVLLTAGADSGHGSGLMREDEVKASDTLSRGVPVRVTVPAAGVTGPSPSFARGFAVAETTPSDSLRAGVSGGGGDSGSPREPRGTHPAKSDEKGPRSSRAGDESGDTLEVKLHDLELVDQDGRKVKFLSDVIGDRVAVVIPFYTTCTTSYPILIYTFTQLQIMLGDRLGKDVVLVSVSVDPRTDIVIRLKAYARRQNAKPGWLFLSGDRNNLGEVLWGVGVLESPNIDEHNHIPIMLVGCATDRWKRFHGFPSPEQAMTAVLNALAARAEREIAKE